MSERCDGSELAAKAWRVHRLLLDYYGEPALKPQRDPLSELVMTILSQNTNDTNSGRAYATLKKRFPTWDEVLQAPGEAVAQAIRVGGLANIKAPRIQHILQKLQDERAALFAAQAGLAGRHTRSSHRPPVGAGAPQDRRRADERPARSAAAAGPLLPLSPQRHSAWSHALQGRQTPLRPLPPGRRVRLLSRRFSGQLGRGLNPGGNRTACAPFQWS